MCWNVEVASSFAAFEFFLILALIGRSYVPDEMIRAFLLAGEKFESDDELQDQINERRARLRLLDHAVVPMCCTIFMVEVSEAAVWADGNLPLLGVETGVGADPEGTCSKISQVNKICTHVAAWAVLLQPVLTMYFAWRGSTARMHGASNGRLFRPMLILSVLTTALWVVRFVVGGLVDVEADGGAGGIAWPCTGSLVGAGGHLVWKWRMVESGLLPNMFTYLLLFQLVFAWYDPPLGFISVLGSLLCLGIEFASVGGSSEAWSIWCVSGCCFITWWLMANWYRASLTPSGVSYHLKFQRVFCCGIGDSEQPVAQLLSIVEPCSNNIQECCSNIPVEIAVNLPPIGNHTNENASCILQGTPLVGDDIKDDAES